MTEEHGRTTLQRGDYAVEVEVEAVYFEDATVSARFRSPRQATYTATEGVPEVWRKALP